MEQMMWSEILVSQKFLLGTCLFSLFFALSLLCVHFFPPKILQSIRSRISRWQRWLAFSALLLLFFAGGLLLFLILPKVVFPTSPSLENQAFGQSNPISIRFDRLVDQSSLKAEINPPLAGDWRLQNSLFGQTSLLFVPAETPAPETRYTVSVTGLKNFIGKKTFDYLFSLETPPPPTIATVSLKEGEEGVLPSQTIEITLDQDPEFLANISFATEPAVELEVKKEGKTFFIRPATPYAKGTIYQFKVFLTNIVYDFKTQMVKTESEKTLLWQATFKTIEAPSVASFSPSGDGIAIDQAISIEFRQSMDRDSVTKNFAVSPETAGQFRWSGDKIVEFLPAKLEKDTRYSVSVAKEAKAIDGSDLAENINFSFTTIGHVRVAGFSPGNNTTGVELDRTISIAFDQVVDKKSAEQNFSIAPAVPGSFAWSGNTLNFTHSNFAYSTKYLIKITAGVKTINGLDSKAEFQSSFTTKSQNLLLDVPSYRQSHMYSCMISAARSALAYRGVNVTEATIIGKVGYDQTPWSGTWAEAGAIWGDPDSAIVGDLDGKADNIGWGYGSHWQPIARAIESLGRSTETKRSMSVSDLAAEIAAGNPVIIWWVNGVWPAYSLSWKTPGGKTVNAVNSMHVQVVRGFSGTVDNPTAFTVTDSGYGYPGKTYDIGTFKAKWAWFGNTGIVVK